MMLDKAVVGSLAASDGKSLADHVALEVGSIGENMALRRAVHLKGGESILSAYVHVSGKLQFRHCFISCFSSACLMLSIHWK